MSDQGRSGSGYDDASRGTMSRIDDALDGRDDPNRGPLDRATNALGGHDDPNRGPLDRAANVISGHDDPNRGPIDRAANAIGGHDDPNRGPLDRAANAVTGGSGGIGAAFSNDHTTDYASGGSNTVSAMFDSHAEAERAVAELRQMGVSDSALSVIAQNKGTMTTRGGDGEVTDEEHTNILRGILGGGALGAGLGVAALAIPGVGPLAALGAIAASAVPEAMAIGAVAGAAAGTFNEALTKHGVSHEDASYYGGRLKDGGVLVTAHVSEAESGRIRDVLYRHGGHTASSARATTL
jgi:hypothetical protein